MDIPTVLSIIRKNIHNIDSGGCGIAALSAIRWAEKNNIKSQIGIVFLYDSFEEEEMDKNCSLIENGHIKEAYTPSHIALLVDGEVIDSRGNWVLGRYDACHSGVSPEELLILINYGNWNDWFVRKDSLPVIEELLDIDLSDIQL